MACNWSTCYLEIGRRTPSERFAPNDSNPADLAWSAPGPPCMGGTRCTCYGSSEGSTQACFSPQITGPTHLQNTQFHCNEIKKDTHEIIHRDREYQDRLIAFTRGDELGGCCCWLKPEAGEIRYRTTITSVVVRTRYELIESIMVIKENHFTMKS